MSAVFSIICLPLSPAEARGQPDIMEVVSLGDRLQTIRLSQGGSVFSLQSKQPNLTEISVMFQAYKQLTIFASLPDTSPGCLGF